MIDRYFVDAPGELNKASAHLLAAGGKRLRPAVVMLAADAVKRGESDEILPAALALEITHTFTLIHDDIMDDDKLRRGVQTVHTKWDMPTGILAGDVLYARAFEFICMAKAKEEAKIRAVSMLARACADICEGQHMDMSFEHRNDVDEYEYMEMVKKKTGVLYAAAAGHRGHPCRWERPAGKGTLHLRAQHRHRVPDTGRSHRSPCTRQKKAGKTGLPISAKESRPSS